MEALFRVFIKDYKNIHDREVRRRYGIFSGAMGIFLNMCLFIFKLFAGTVTSSISIIADALNNLSDAGSSIITLIGFKLSGKPADHDHPFGHGRIEYLSALFVSMAILLMGFELGKSSIEKIISPGELEFSTVSVIILVAAIAVKGWMYFFNKKVGKKISSQSMTAAAKDSLSDAVSTFAVLLSLLISELFSVNIDGYTGLAVSIFILYTGFCTVRDSMSPLLGVPPDKELVNAISKTITEHKEIAGIHDMIIHNYGPTRFMMSVHAEIPANSDILKIHDTIDIIERELAAKFDCDAVIHMDPIETDNEAINNMKEKISDIIKKMDSSFTMHDFRMVSGETHTNLIFDIVVPYDYKMNDKEIRSEIQKKVSEYDNSLYTVVTIDKNYT